MRWVQGWRRRVLAAGLLAYPVVTAAGMAQRDTSAVGYVLVALFACAYVFAWRNLWRSVAAMAVLVVLVLPYAHADAFFLAAVVASLAASAARRYAAVIVGASVAAALVVPWLYSWGSGWVPAITIVFTALTVIGSAQIAAANQALLAARTEVARLAAEAERSRIARDLHDLLGHSLTAITVKSDLARRLDGEAARREIAEVETLSRQALADVRAAVSGYRDVTLAGELARGRELLRASGVAAHLPTGVDPGPHHELFGWVVREGLTNVVRHAHASRCVIMVSASEVEIVDDGVGGEADAGSGLTGLRERVEAAGGRMSAGPVRPHGWRLRVSV